MGRGLWSPKVGSSRWKRLLIKKHAPSLDPSQIDPHHSPMTWLDPGEVKREDLVANTSHPSNLRFLWLRNPYSRLLSGFLDEGVARARQYDNGMMGYGAPFEPFSSEFLRFVKALTAMRADGLPLDKHLKPQAEQCGLPDGMQYDFYLKVEDIHVWYPDLVSLLGLEDVVSHGWDHASEPTVPEGTPPCFYPLPGKTCDLTDLIIEHHSASVEALREYGAHSPRASIPSREEKPAWMTAATSHHAHNADAQVMAYYNNEEVVKLATEFLREDLERFGYRKMRWNEDQ
eukprot:jgi/Tetstr1/435438/TSEL_024344.t1